MLAVQEHGWVDFDATLRGNKMSRLITSSISLVHRESPASTCSTDDALPAKVRPTDGFYNYAQQSKRVPQSQANVGTTNWFDRYGPGSQREHMLAKVRKETRARKKQEIEAQRRQAMERHRHRAAEAEWIRLNQLGESGSEGSATSHDFLVTGIQCPWATSSDSSCFSFGRSRSSEVASTASSDASSVDPFEVGNTTPLLMPSSQMTNEFSSSESTRRRVRPRSAGIMQASKVSNDKCLSKTMDDVVRPQPNISRMARPKSAVVTQSDRGRKIGIETGEVARAWVSRPTSATSSTAQRRGSQDFVPAAAADMTNRHVKKAAFPPRSVAMFGQYTRFGEAGNQENPRTCGWTGIVCSKFVL